MKKFQRHNAAYVALTCKPSKSLARSLSLEREVLALIASYNDIHARALSIAVDYIEQHTPRLQKDFCILIHNDPEGDIKLRSWAKEVNMTCCPIYNKKTSGMPASDALRHKLSSEIFSANPFAVTGPVVDDRDFFGRRNDAIEIHRLLTTGRIHSIFGLRKTGKTSLLNRVISIAREERSMNVGVIDCSKREFFSLPVDQALKATAKVLLTAETRGYSNLVDAFRYQKDDLNLTFESIFGRRQTKPLCLVFDEIDYVTPIPPTIDAYHWQDGFCQYWREIRFFIQEAQRQGFTISLVVAGVSTKFFNCATIGGEENPVLQFIPDTYLVPFADAAATSMIRELGKRCGMYFDKPAAEVIARECGFFPFWIRSFCGFLHDQISIESRPITLTTEDVLGALNEWLCGEGVDIATIALSYMKKLYPELLDAARGNGYQDKIGRVLTAYGIADIKDGSIFFKSKAFASALDGLEQATTDGLGAGPRQANMEAVSGGTDLLDVQWAEELALLNKRRNALEKRLRNFIYFTLKFHNKDKKKWPDNLLDALTTDRRKRLAILQDDKMPEALYWRELGLIVQANWVTFEKMIRNSARFEQAIDLVNDRPDAHAKPVDLADLALQRRELKWLESIV